MSEHGLLERKDEDTPAYRLTEKGHDFLEDKVDAEELRE